MDYKYANSVLMSSSRMPGSMYDSSGIICHKAHGFMFWIPAFARMTFFVVMALTLLAMTVPSAAYAAEGPKIAVVDVQYVLDHSVAVARLREAIDKLSEKLHKEMSDKESSLKNAEAELIKKRDSMKQEQFDTEVNAFYKRVSEAQHEMQQKKAKLEQAHAEAIGIVHDSTLKIISELSKEKKLQVVLPTSQILYADEVLHMTSNVVTELNKQVKSIPLNYK